MTYENAVANSRRRHRFARPGRTDGQKVRSQNDCGDERHRQARRQIGRAHHGQGQAAQADRATDEVAREAEASIVKKGGSRNGQNASWKPTFTSRLTEKYGVTPPIAATGTPASMLKSIRKRSGPPRVCAQSAPPPTRSGPVATV